MKDADDGGKYLRVRRSGSALTGHQRPGITSRNDPGNFCSDLNYREAAEQDEQASDYTLSSIRKALEELGPGAVLSLRDKRIGGKIHKLSSKELTRIDFGGADLSNAHIGSLPYYKAFQIDGTTQFSSSQRESMADQIDEKIRERQKNPPPSSSILPDDIASSPDGKYL